MRITVNFYLNDENEKDKTLLDWLNDQSNRSAFIRIKLYELMISENGQNYIAPKIKNQATEEISISDGFLNSIGGIM